MAARSRAMVVVALAALPLAACTLPGDAPAAAVADFYAAVADGDGAAACADLTPAVVAAVEEEAGSSCADALTTGDLGDDLQDRAQGTTAPRVRVAGRQAQAVLGTDTVFLSRSGSGWLITAAGCTPRPERPYDCEVAA
ncbi:hypothetical protein [Cellulomonas sp. GbtcB1]|uniref:hypothetical protein n=1 Tax=Cellulomonas sp. GbtcB1 TaxID=2824746 RepID=UPI001C2F4010|nr:hypothetical protein [Cellulomonas sp. GbtcB1]